MINWFRSYHGAPTDMKFVTIAKRSETQVCVTVAIWWALLDYASQQPERGSIAGFDTEAIAEFYGLDEATVVRVLDVMRDKGLVSDERITNWEKRQPKREDNSTERVRRHREKQGTDGNAVKRSVTRGNAREEKRREEKKRVTTTTSAAASAAPSPSHEEPPRPRRSRSAAVGSHADEGAPRETWLTPALEAWERHKGPGSFRVKQAAGLFARLHQAGLSPEEIGRRLDRYCELRKGKFCTLADFVANHGEFVPPDPSTLYDNGWMSAELERETRPPAVGARP